ncbi:MAG TPA: cytochrome c3 family protein [Kofleriaceae bacterium]|nr:cytochrome c3 family protein [Kofleriaceae bacterium]
MRALVVMLAVGAACGRPSSPAHVTPSPGGITSSNILRADYAGSRACAECHKELFDRWAASPMRNMTRDAATATIRAPFDGATLRVGTETATMEMDGKVRVMRVVDASGTHRFKITKVVGGRYREDFVGVEQGGDGLEHVLPATYVFATRSWRYKGYSVMVKERPRMSWRGVWSRECIPCHNTLPYVTMLYDELHGPGLPGYQGKLSDRVLPPSRTWKAAALDVPGLSRELDSEIAFLGGEKPQETELKPVLVTAATTMLKKLDGAHLVELGVGCEACHNGAKAHAHDSNITPAFEPRSSLVGITPPPGQSGTRTQWINRTCAKCHTVLFTHYDWTWEGANRKDQHPGGSTTNSGEGRDFQLGGCSTQLACTGCHDPHVEDAPAKLAEMATPKGNGVCTSCHKQFASEKAIEIHTHHASGSTGTSCVACHMAKKNMGLDYALVRYHRIGSPTETRRVAGDRPLECALCHADKSVEQLVTTMEQWWHKKYDRDALKALYGDDLSVNAIRATLERGKPHEQAAAIGVLGDAKDKSAVAALVPMLSHEYPLVRFYAQRALQKITGDPVAIDVGGAAADVQRDANAWLAKQKGP